MKNALLFLEYFSSGEFMLALILLIFILNLGLVIFSIVDIVKSKTMAKEDKSTWIIVLIFLGLMGVIIYWLAIRKKQE